MKVAFITGVTGQDIQRIILLKIFMNLIRCILSKETQIVQLMYLQNGVKLECPQETEPIRIFQKYFLS